MGASSHIRFSLLFMWGGLGRDVWLKQNSLGHVGLAKMLGSSMKCILPPIFSDKYVSCCYGRFWIDSFSKTLEFSYIEHSSLLSEHVTIIILPKPGMKSYDWLVENTDIIVMLPIGLPNKLFRTLKDSSRVLPGYEQCNMTCDCWVSEYKF